MTNDDRGWRRIMLAGPHQDKIGWTNEATGEYFPPTHNWTFQLIAERSDKQFFHVNISLTEKEWEGLSGSPALLTIKFQQAFVLLEEFRTCDCVQGKPCDQHARPAVEA